MHDLLTFSRHYGAPLYAVHWFARVLFFFTLTFFILFIYRIKVDIEKLKKCDKSSDPLYLIDLKDRLFGWISGIIVFIPILIAALSKVY